MSKKIRMIIHSRYWVIFIQDRGTMYVLVARTIEQTTHGTWSIHGKIGYYRMDQ